MLKPVSGTWFEFTHHNVAEGKYWSNELRNFTEEQWEEKIDEIASVGMKYIVLLASSHKDDDEGIEESYFETDIFPAADIKCKNPMDVLFRAAEKNDLKIFVSTSFYGHWKQPWINRLDPEIVNRSFKAMKQLYEKYGHYKSFYGWYFAEESTVRPCFREDVIAYLNHYTKFAHTFAPHTKTLFAPYGTPGAVVDDHFIEQLGRIDVDYIAYMDKVGVERVEPEDNIEVFKKLKAAHDKVGRSKFWCDMELFDFEGEIYKSPLVAPDIERARRQIEAVSPYADVLLCYQYQGMMNKPGTKAYCGSDGSEALYNMIKEHNDKCRK